jgi:hypothetical protein
MVRALSREPVHHILIVCECSGAVIGGGFEPQNLISIWRARLQIAGLGAAALSGRTTLTRLPRGSASRATHAKKRALECGI